MFSLDNSTIDRDQLSRRIGQKVKVYRNLHKDTWSLMATEGPRKGRVIGYAKEVLLTDPVLTVSEASRQRAIREKARNVHAFVIGVMQPTASLEGPLQRVRYNPFQAGCFTNPVGVCVVEGKVALLDAQGSLWMDLIDPDFTLLLARATEVLREELRAKVPERYLSEFLARKQPELEALVRRQLGRGM
jgi:hypothetical protein